jgi:hypothetical protein
MYYEVEKILRRIAKENPEFDDFNNEVYKNFYFLDQGTYRKVYSTIDDDGKPIVFKIRKYSDVSSQNLKEWELGCHIKAKLPYMASFVLMPLEYFNFHVNDVIIFPKVEVLIGKTESELLQDRSEKFIATFKFIEYAFHDVIVDNIGIVNELPVLIDFAPGFVHHRMNLLEEKARQVLEMPTPSLAI